VGLEIYCLIFSFKLFIQVKFCSPQLKSKPEKNSFFEILILWILFGIKKEIALLVYDIILPIAFYTVRQIESYKEI